MRKTALIFGPIWLLMASVCLADGVIIPMPPRPGEPFPPALSIKYHRVDVEITDQVARTKVDQVFINHHPRDLEGTYIFPIPENASISRFSMWVAGEELRGEILDRDEARRVYEEIVRRKRDPALLEYVGRDAFKARIYPIPGRGEKRVTLDYQEVLKLDNGLCQYRYSLDTEKFSRDPIEEVKIAISLVSRSPIKSVYSPTHEIEVERKSDRQVEITYVERNTRPDRDLILYYTVSEEELGLNLLTYREDGEKGFFLGMISPSQQVFRSRVVEKDIVFVLDRSGSMSGEKIEQAKSSLLFCLNSLNPKDRFNLICFNERVDEYERGLVEASPAHVKGARRYIRALEAVGGTDINTALLTALREIERAERPAFVVFLTDGLPTVGETHPPTILDNVKEAVKGKPRIFAFGVGYDVNTQLLDRLASENRGTSDYVRPEEDIEVKVSSFYTKIASPVLTDLELDFGRIRVSEIYPRVLPDLFKGSQLIILGRYDGRGSTRVRLSGLAGEKRRDFSYKAKFPRGNEEMDFIPRLWASRKIGYLIEEIRSHGENKELVDEIVRLSKEYGIVTEYTSFLVDVDEKVAMRDLEKKAYKVMSEAAAPATGGWAVNQSKNVRALQRSAQVPQNVYYDAHGRAQQVKGVAQIGVKNFFNKKENWVDSDYDPNQKLIKVKRFSRAYFQLIERDDAVAQYLSLGDEVLFNIGRNSIQIGGEGKEEFTEKELARLFE